MAFLTIAGAGVEEIGFQIQIETLVGVGGEKAGKWSDWHKAAIPLAEEAYADYLRNEEN